MKELIQVGKSKIYFDRENHGFWDTDNNRLLSVTAITGVIDKSDALMGWAVRLAKDYLLEKIQNKEQITSLDVEEASKEYRKKKEEAADIGTLIHEWVSTWITGKKPRIPEEEKLHGGITAFLKFQKEYEVKWLESEMVVYSRKHGYAGILDAVGKIGSKTFLVDFKSSNAIYPEYALQTAGYQICYEEMMKKKIDSRMIVRFGKDTGEFEFKRFEDNEVDKRAFLACKEIKERLRAFKM